MDLRYKTFTTEIKAEADTRQMHFLISTDAVDRDNDTLDPKGWQLDNYMRNPVVAFAHDYKALPVAKCLRIGQTAKGLEATAEFPPKGTYAFADTVYDMLKSGFLNATSVGFRPIDFEAAPDRKGFNFHSQELTEFSIVPIPSNPQALVQQRSAGVPDAEIRTWCKALIGWAKQARHPAQERVSTLLGAQYIAKDEAAWAAFEKDYDVEAESGELPVARVAKLLALHGFAEEAKALGLEPVTKVDVQLDYATIAAEVAKLLKPKAEEPYFQLLDDDTNMISFDDAMLKDALTALGPELSEVVAGKTKNTINQMLGRID